MVVEVENLNKFYRKRFKSIHFLKNVSFKVEKGQILGILGKKGSGKTTLLKILTGLISDKSVYGAVRILGNEDIQTIKSRIGFLPENPEFFKYISGEEFIEFSLRMSGVYVSNTRINDVLKDVNLLDAKNERLKIFSHGMVRRIGIAQAIAHSPDVLLMDEPMSGLGLDDRIQVIDIIRNYSRKGKTVIFSTQSEHDIESLCTHVIILRNGEITWEKSLSELKEESEYTIEVEHKGKKKILRAKNPSKLLKQLDNMRMKDMKVMNVCQLLSESIKKHYD